MASRRKDAAGGGPRANRRGEVEEFQQRALNLVHDLQTDAASFATFASISNAALEDLSQALSPEGNVGANLHGAPNEVLASPSSLIATATTE